MTITRENLNLDTKIRFKMLEESGVPMHKEMNDAVLAALNIVMEWEEVSGVGDFNDVMASLIEAYLKQVHGCEGFTPERIKDIFSVFEDSLQEGTLEIV